MESALGFRAADGLSTFASGRTSDLDTPALLHEWRTRPLASRLSPRGGAGEGVVGLRTRLLEEARRERERCLLLSETAQRRQFEHAAVQTDPAAGNATSWSEADDLAQAEAIRTIRMLTERGEPRREGARPLGTGPDVAGDFGQEHGRAQAAWEQVRCLEAELDSKESAIQVLERTLERRDEDLQRAQNEIRKLQQQQAAVELAATPHARLGEYERIRALREQVLELEHQVRLRDAQIAHLARAPKQLQGGLADEASTFCGSDALMSTAPSTVNWSP
mmetsp:Transcript_79811/g.247989  ORF Transcript_79811/g.247989 Transcript_79811/m.247989 type:complete len:277 (-) Transcript_79811:118-948(-)